ncbi:hypothetical protein SAMN05192566_0762 [Methylophilus rhizosphaerae]|uniref:Uncharacterized protein n=1 Tax=Methylophilus rhizosphaerae TaxID=492660 RepID=A0A1G9ABN8_9PROT|nr:hypothetical protein SAMN05192566_0762 [Methylophilus rhizosphaerae]
MLNRFYEIWVHVVKPNKMDLFRRQFKQFLIDNGKFNEKKFTSFCQVFLKDNMTFKSDIEMKKHCQIMYERYIEHF